VVSLLILVGSSAPKVGEDLYHEHDQREQDGGEQIQQAQKPQRHKGHGQYAHEEALPYGSRQLLGFAGQGVEALVQGKGERRDRTRYCGPPNNQEDRLIDGIGWPTMHERDQAKPQ